MEKKFATLYSKKSTNKILQWNISVTGNKEVGTITTVYGDINGKMITNVRDIKEGKNLGKKNETTPFEQAILEATSKWKSKVNKDGYIEVLDIKLDSDKDSKQNKKSKTISKPELSSIRPMLANKYEDKKKYIVYPCFVQPKLDGVRCLAYKENGDVRLMSRQGKMFPHLDHIKKSLAKLNFEGFLDGELFTTDLEFKQISGIVRKEKLESKDIEISKLIQYHIYDTFNLDKLDMEFSERTNVINGTIRGNKTIVKVKTYNCKTEKDMLAKYNEFMTQNYEGIMIRNMKGKYKLKHRSNDLIKLKPFQDHEYKIVGFKEGTGRDKGCVIWICDNGSGKQFNVRPKGSMEERKDLFDNGNDYIGKMLTVRFQELLDDSPRFGIGIGVRDYE